MRTSKYRRLSSCGIAEIPGGESATNRCVSCEGRRGGSMVSEGVRRKGEEVERVSSASFPPGGWL